VVLGWAKQRRAFPCGRPKGDGAGGGCDEAER
jgi:hypothetical protein